MLAWASISIDNKLIRCSSGLRLLPQHPTLFWVFFCCHTPVLQEWVTDRILSALEGFVQSFIIRSALAGKYRTHAKQGEPLGTGLGTT